MAQLSEFEREQARIWPQVRAELAAGHKDSHWIWWFFPQLAKLGRSQRSRDFGLSGLEEATAFLAHPVLGPRLVECSNLLLAQRDRSAEEMLGPVDALKVQSCMTLFEAVPGAPAVFAQVLDRLYSGARCRVTTAAIRDY